MARLSELIALTMGASPAVAGQIRTAAALHDVGKQKIPADILNKPGKLTAQEFEIVKTHTVLGAEMLSSIQGELGAKARACSLLHHECFDGSGYWGRRYNELPFFVPYVTISDVFTSLISERVYKHAWPPAEAMDYIQNHAGTLFDPELVSVFLPLIRKDGRVTAIFCGEGAKP